jgi:hypothetical protein
VNTELVEQQAQMVLATLADANAATLFAFAEGLKHVDGPASRFHLPIYHLASNRERSEPPGRAHHAHDALGASGLRDVEAGRVHRHARRRTVAVLGGRTGGTRGSASRAQAGVAAGAPVGGGIRQEHLPPAASAGHSQIPSGSTSWNALAAGVREIAASGSREDLDGQRLIAEPRRDDPGSRGRRCAVDWLWFGRIEKRGVAHVLAHAPQRSTRS